MDARGTSAWRKKRTARPPRATKSGAPKTTARRRVTTAAANGMPPRIRPEETNATPATAPAAPAARAPAPSGRAADEPPRDEGEAQRDNAFRDPQGEKRNDVMAVRPLRPDELEARSREQEGDGGGDGGDEGGQDPSVRLPAP